MSESYYLKKIPQSEYRRVQDGGSSEEERGQFIDLDLCDLNITDPRLKAALVEKIFSEGQNLVRALLPEELQHTALTPKHLEDIYTRLGLK